MEAKCCSKCKKVLTLDMFKIRGNGRTKSCMGCFAKARERRRTCKDPVIEHEIDPLDIDREIRGFQQDKDYLLLYTLFTYNIIPRYIELIEAPPENYEKELIVKRYRKVLRYLGGKIVFDPIEYRTQNTKLCPTCRNLLENKQGGVLICRDCAALYPKIHDRKWGNY